MARVNLHLSEELKAKMVIHPEINWSGEFQKLVEKLTTDRDWLLVASTNKSTYGRTTIALHFRQPDETDVQS